jgi:hypothetical protein
MGSASKPFGVVYLITNTVNGKVYVGQTTVGVSKRWKGHKDEARKGSECRDGYRRGAPGNSTAVDEGILRVALQGLTSIQYDAQRRSKVLDARFVSSNAFPRVYGKTFMEVRDGVRDPRQTKRRAA